MSEETRRLRYVVMHRPYGCETGCCGHSILLPDGEEIEDSFRFEHPYDATTDEERKAWAEQFLRAELGEKHVKDLLWEESEVFVDC
jgi:hypothetical protein